MSAILVCGSSRRIPRRASCPSCSQDCPEALTVQLPWHPGQKSNLQPRVLRDFPVNSLQNSIHSGLIQKGIPQDITRDDNILPSKSSASFGNYKSFSPQGSTSGNLFFKNFLNKFPNLLDRREMFSRNKSLNRYPLARVPPSKQNFKSENIFKNARNKYFSSSLGDDNFQNNIKDKEDPTSKMLVVYHADKDAEPLDSRDASSSNIILPQRFVPKVENTFQSRQDLVPRIFDAKRNALVKSPSFVNQQHSLTYPRKEFNSADSYVHPLGDVNIWKPIKNDEFFDNWDDIKDSSQSSNLKQLKQAENKFLEMYPSKEQKIITENEQINNSYMFPQNLDIQQLMDNRELFDDWDYASYKDSQESAKINRLQETGNNWLQVFPTMRKNIEHFENERGKHKEFAEQENMNQEYFEDEAVQDTIETQQNRYNPYALQQNTNIWETIQDEELFDNLDFIRKNSQKMDQLEMHPEENNDKYFQNVGNKDIILEKESKTQTIYNNDRAPVINGYNDYTVPRNLNILNDAKYPIDSSEIQKITEATNNILRANPMEERHERFFVDDINQNDAHIQDLINTQTLRLDPDLLDDVDFPLEPTESTSTESLTEFSTPKQ